RRTGAFRCAICASNGLQDRGSRPRKRQRTARRTTGRASIRRFKRRRSGGGITEARWRARNPSDRAKRKSNLCRRGWIRSERQFVSAGGADGTTERQYAVVDSGETIRLRVLFRHCARFAG